MTLNTCGNQKGYVLVTTYMMMTVLSITSMASFMRSHTFVREAEKQKNAIVALEMAEAGIDQAIVQMASNSSYAGTGYTDFSSGNARGGYTITVTTPAGAPTSVRKIAVVGYSPSNTATQIGYKRSDINVYTQFPNQSFFTRALFANTSYSNNGNGLTDSYDSGNGAYSAATARNRGDVGTNSTANGAVSLTGNGTVNGSVTVGPSGNVNTVISTNGNTVITGTSSAAPAATVLATPTAPIASSGNLSLSGNTNLSLTAGTYHYNQLSISGNARLTTTGEVTLYISGSVAISGNGTAAYQNLSKNLKIFVTTNSSVAISGNGNTYAAVYAPLSSVAISGNGSIYGAVVGNNVTMSGNANFHYDEALGSVVGSAAGDPTLLAWVQSGNSSWTN